MATYDPGGSPTFPSFPVTIITNGDPGNAETWNRVYRDVFDGLQRLKIDTDEDIGVMSALQTKLGVPVAGSGDTALPTYASGVLLVGPLSHHTSLETLDTGLGAQTTRINNVDSNVGGSVTAGGSPVYASGGTVFSDGDSHHTALEKIDDYAALNRSLATTAASDASSASSGVTNIAAKLGTGAELAPPFDWIYELLISDGQSLKTIVDNFDRYTWANQRLADQAYGNMVKLWKAQLSAAFTFYDTLINGTKFHGSSTASPDLFLYQVTGDGLDMVWVMGLPGSHSEVALLWDIEGTVTFKANLIGSLNDADFDTIGSQNLFVVAATGGAGTSLVVKATISGASSKLFNIAAATKV